MRDKIQPVLYAPVYNCFLQTLPCTDLMVVWKGYIQEIECRAAKWSIQYVLGSGDSPDVEVLTCNLRAP